MNKAGQGQFALAARQALEAAGSARLPYLQTALADGRHLAEHRQEALLLHYLEQLRGLEAVANGILPEPIGLIGHQKGAKLLRRQARSDQVRA